MTSLSNRPNTALVVIDVQEAFRKAIPTFDDVARATGTLIEGAKAIRIPVVATEQYPKGLGRTVPEVADRLPDGATPLEKVVFSAAGADGFELDAYRADPDLQKYALTFNPGGYLRRVR